jgi:uncharacterized cupin superfamily protein
MQKVAVDDTGHATDGRGRERRGLTGALGAEDVAINHYRVAPGERISSLHGHGDQEEVFLVVDGAMTFETFEAEADGGREVQVAAGEAVRFGPGEYQSGKNASDDQATAYALGAPPETEDVHVPLSCPDCGHDHVRPTLSAGGDPVLVCPDCGAETSVECPDCGSDEMHAVLGEAGRPVSACEDCGYASPTL